MPEHAYRTNNPAAIAAYRTALTALTAFQARFDQDVQALGAGPLRPRGGPAAFGGPVEIRALRYVGDAHVPFGWRVVLRNRTYEVEPRIAGLGAAAAKQWLSEHQPGTACDPAYVLKPHGMAYHSRVRCSDSYNTYFPTLFEHDGYLWVWYERGVPEGDFYGDPFEITWEPVPVVELTAAREAARNANEKIKETV